LEAVTLQALRTILLILPGLISLRIKAALSISSPSKPLNAAIDGLILTLVDHATLAAVKIVGVAMLPATLVESTRRLSRDLIGASGLPPEIAQQFAASGGFMIVVVAIVVGAAAGVVRFNGWDFRLLRHLKATNRTGENLVWAETLTKSARDTYALVACQDGSRFIGIVDTFSEEAGNYEILLSHASQVELDGTLLPIDGEGVLLTRENPIIRVELWAPGGRGSMVTGGPVNV
jgi:hypothetical protein